MAVLLMIEKDVFDRVFAAFRPGILQDAAHVMRIAQANGWTVDEYVERINQTVLENKWQQIEAGKRLLESRQYLKMHGRRCADCGLIMNLLPVNHSPRAQVGGPYQCVWQCADLIGCGNEIYSERPLLDEARDYNLEEFFDTAAKQARARKAAIRRSQLNLPAANRP
jgi:hypothetical protein